MLACKSYYWQHYYSQEAPRRMTELHLAAYAGITGLVSTILRSTEMNSKDTDGRTPLSYAAENNHEAVIKLLLSMEKIENNSKNINDQTPLS